ncbi:hypothetical protein [Ovoidimarina sediminis]|uniref:hypothetical protein n=1 Tax=Ovoidimarina sediminis TaxID=3079856 RepID=UPI0029090F5C|nr:hypothetical protein [Rhodophyticola sp. MJ-SS7]MDU8946687.1 hypothetical protein [Rhodophyticola sp. MJ-SS7]
MTGTKSLNLQPPEFERFLHATIGEDQNGYAVTVLSMLARLGLDPWNETADLVTIGRESAGARLGSLLSRFRDVPTLGSDHGRVARELILLLPESTPAQTFQRAASTVADGRLGSSGAIWTILAIIFVMFQMFIVGGSGSGQ